MRVRYALLPACALLLAACAETPQRPLAPAPAPSAADPAQSRSIARHKALADQYGKSGDLAKAAVHWQAVVLLEPDNAANRAALAETRIAISRVANEQLAAGMAAMRAGDTDRATSAMLKVLAADPGNAEAARVLREIEKQRAGRTQAAMAARARTETTMLAAASGSARNGDAREAYELEQRIEMFRAGDTNGGLRELTRFVDANPTDKAARAQIGSAVYERGRDLEASGAREEALQFYDQAIALRGEKVAEWTSRANALRRYLGNEYYEKGLKSWTTDRMLAIRQWEASLRFDPANARAAARLAEARRLLGNR